MIFKPKCKCGYKFDDLFFGGGMILNNKEYFLPFYCDPCEIVIGRNIMDESGYDLKKYNKCPNCRKKIQFYGSISDKKSLINSPYRGKDEFFRIEFDRRYNFEDNKNYCPKCKKNNLKFDYLPSGCFD